MNLNLQVLIISFLCLTPYIFYLYQNKGDVLSSNDFDIYYKIAIIVVIISMILEFIRGSLHFFYPIKSHTEVSKIVETYNIDMSKPNPLFLVTFQYGAANLLLGFMYMSTLLFSSEKINAIKFVLVTTMMVRTLQILNTKFKIWDGQIFDLPEDSEIKAPGKVLQSLQLPLMFVGLISIFVSKS